MNQVSALSLGLSKTEQQAVLLGPKRVASAFRILSYVESQSDGSTCCECHDALGISENSCSPRFSELLRAGCIKSNGKYRRTSNGGRAKVYVVDRPDFLLYLSLIRNLVNIRPASTRSRVVLAAVSEFLPVWMTSTSKESRSGALKKLLACLEELARK